MDCLRSIVQFPRLLTTLFFCLLPAAFTPVAAGVYVTEASGIRWNDVGGIRWNDVGGIRWNDVGGIRWNDVGGIRWNDVGGILTTDASGIRWNDVGGIRWNDVGGIQFDDALWSGGTSVDLDLLNILSSLPDSSAINVIVTYRANPTAADLAALNAIGIPGGTLFRRLPMVVVNATRDQMAAIAAMPAVRSLYTNRNLSFFDEESGALIGLDDASVDPDLRIGGFPFSGAGVTIAVLDSGVDATHPDLPAGTKVVGNVRLMGAIGSGPGFVAPAFIEGIPNTDLILGHGTFVASVAAGTGAASGGVYRGVAPGAGILALSAGDLYILNMLEGFDYLLDNAARYGVRVLNCSWGHTGFFDPDDPVNIATRLLYDAGITVVFAAGNHGPSPDTLNAYSVAPWVIGVGSVKKDGSLSRFSSRGIFEETLYHPLLVAPGEGIVAASPVALNAVNGIAGVADPSGGAVVQPAFGTWYTASSGTSFAAPHVAGVVALMLEASPGLTVSEIRRILQATATPDLRHDRSESGAGRLDAWAALTQVLNSARPFGTHIPGWLDLRPWRIVHRQPSLSTGIVPASGAVSIPTALDGPVLSWSLTLSWEGFPAIGDLDLDVFDAGGAEVARSESISALGLFGLTEGAHLLGAVPPSLLSTIHFKGGAGLLDQPFALREETAEAELTAYPDVGGLDPSVVERITRAVSLRVMIGRGGSFEPSAALTRGELARSLALAAGAPQRIPSLPSYQDTPLSDPAGPYVESVAGLRADRVLMDPKNASTFGPNQPVARLDFAVAIVRAAGLEAEATSRAGESLSLLDESKIPPVLAGYVAVALERGLIDTVVFGDEAKFDPKGAVPRADAALFLLNLLAGGAQAGPSNAATAAGGGGSRMQFPSRTAL